MNYHRWLEDMDKKGYLPEKKKGPTDSNVLPFPKKDMDQADASERQASDTEERQPKAA